MKRTILMAALAVMFISCQKEQSADFSPKRVELTFHGGVSDSDTKVSYTKDEAKYAFSWDDGDKISLIVADGTGLNDNNLMTVKTAGPSSEISGTVTTWKGQRNAYAVYPYMSYTASAGEKGLSYKIIDGDDIEDAALRIYRSYQRISVGEDKAATSLLVATAPDSTFPEEGGCSIENLSFVQLLSMLRLNITDVPADYKVTSVSFTTDAAVFPLTADVSLSSLAVPVFSHLRSTSEITSIVTDAPVGEDTKLNFSLIPTDLTGRTVTVSVLLKGASDSKLVMVNKAGISLNANTVYTLNISAASGQTLPRDAEPVEWGGVSYNTKISRDGNVWFTQNLRYVPEGKTPSSSLNAIDNGLWYPIDLSKKSFTTNPEDIAAKGYLYNAETAFGLAPGTINLSNYDTYEGVQGICPQGWHIPTHTDILGLAGKCNNHTDFTDAPYFVGTNSNFPEANENGGLNIAIVGYVIVSNKSATNGLINNVMSFILGSTAYSKEMGNTTMFDTDGTLKNVVYYSFMPQKNNSFNGNNYNYRSGVSVRCVRKAVPADFE